MKNKTLKDQKDPKQNTNFNSKANKSPNLKSSTTLNNNLNNQNNWLHFLPIILMLIVVPFMTRMTVQTPAQYIIEAWGQPGIIDFNSFYKSIGIIVLSAIMILSLFFTFKKQNLKTGKELNIMYTAFGVYALLTIASAIFSSYPELAYWGQPERYEGLWVNLSYMIMMMYTIYILKSEKDLKYVIIPLSVLTIATAFLGVFQYFGLDLLTQTSIGQSLILPKEYLSQVENLSLTYQSGKVYGTMYHYNYAGSFGAMVVPLFATLAIFIKDKKLRLTFGVLTLISMFVLFGSTSRAGLIGLVFAGLFFVIIFYKDIFSSIKLIGIIAATLVVVVIALNFVTGGTIFERIPSLINDALAIFTQSDETFDYKDHILVRDIVNNQDGSVTFVMQENKLTMSAGKNDVEFRDQNGIIVDFERIDGAYQTSNSRFIGYTAEILLPKGSTEQDLPGGLQLYTPDGGMFPIIVSQEEMYLANIYTQQKIDLGDVESIGFVGKEKLGSARGYIWSRSLPLLRDNILLGSGPDTYWLEFPQEDLLGKYYAYGTPQILVDKPHNLYLQIAFNGGIISLLAFIVAIGMYLLQSIKLYLGKKEKTNLMVYGSGFTLAVIGYLGAGLFNDSLVSVAPIFWIILGTGIGINYLIKKNLEN